MNPRGRIQCTTRAIPVGTCEVSGFKPRIIVYIRTGSRRFRDDFYKARIHLGLDVQEVQAFGDWVTVYDVAGTVEALEAFVARACVERWHYALDARVPFRGMGGGDKPKRQPHPMEERLNVHRKRDAERDKIATMEPSSLRTK